MLMTDLAINTTAAAFLAGVITSLHCAGMCGPLVCAALPRPSPSYHFGRLAAYGAVGASCGAVGELPLKAAMRSPLVVLPWVLVVFMVIVALGFKPKIPRPLFLRKWYARRVLGSSFVTKGLVLGLLTPLLPCGPLYLLFGACLVSGSAAAGLEFAVAFALGTVPLLWLTHSSMGLLSRKISPQRLLQIQRSLALVAAVIMAWRLRGTLGIGTPEEPPCPLCAE